MDAPPALDREEHALMTMGSVTAGIVLVDRVDYVEEDRYLVLGHAVDLV